MLIPEFDLSALAGYGLRTSERTMLFKIYKFSDLGF
jgi:hypothetical protein